MNRPPQVHIDDPFPVVVGHLSDRSAGGDPSVVKHHVNMTEVRVRALGERLNSVVVTNVSAHSYCLTDASQFPYRSSQPNVLDVCQDNVPASLSKRPGCRESNTARSPSDNRHLRWCHFCSHLDHQPRASCVDLLSGGAGEHANT